MGDYNFWQDFFDTYQSLSDSMKFAWLVVPPIFLLGLLTLILRYRLAHKRLKKAIDGKLVYTINRDADHRLTVLRHDKPGDGSPEILLLEGLAAHIRQPEEARPESAETL